MTRSRRIGKARIGATVTVSPGGRVSMRVMHMRDGTPVDLRRARPALARLAVPPAGQVGRLGRLDPVDDVEHHLALLTAGITYSVNSPPVSSPRQRRMVTSPPGCGCHGFLGHQVASSNSSFRSSGITGMGSGVTVMVRIDGVPTTPSELPSVMRWTKLTEPISGTGFG